MADNQKMGKARSGGRRIDDHSFWAGPKGKDSVFPDGPYKTKNESSAEGAGSLMYYEDTTDKIKDQQEMGIKKIHAHSTKPFERN